MTKRIHLDPQYLLERSKELPRQDPFPLSNLVIGMSARPPKTVGMPITRPENVGLPPKYSAYLADEDTMMKNETFGGWR